CPFFPAPDFPPNIRRLATSLGINEHPGQAKLPSSAEEGWPRPQENIAKIPSWCGRGGVGQEFPGQHHPVCARYGRFATFFDRASTPYSFQGTGLAVCYVSSSGLWAMWERRTRVRRCEAAV